MRIGKCTQVLTGDTVVLDQGSKVRLRYSNVWAPLLGTPLGEETRTYNQDLVLGKTLRYTPNGHVHWADQSIVAEVYLDDLWVNQALRSWLSSRTKAPQWVDGIPGAENIPTDAGIKPAN